MKGKSGLVTTDGSQIGSGDAQVFNSNILQVVAGVQERKDRAALDKIKRDAAGRKATQAAMKVEGDVWEYDRQEVQDKVNKMLDVGAAYGVAGVDITDPSTDAYKVVDSMRREIDSLINMSQAHQKAYNDGMAKADFKKYDEGNFNATITPFLGANSIAERDQLNRNFLSEPFNEFAIFDDMLATPAYKTSIEDGDLTTVNGGANLTKINRLFDNMMAGRGGVGQTWLADGMRVGRWENEEDARKFFVETLADSVPTSHEEKEDEGKGDFDLSFGAGGSGTASEDDLTLAMEIKEREAGGGNYIAGALTRNNKTVLPFYVDHTDKDGKRSRVLFSPSRVMADLNGENVFLTGPKYVEKGASGREIANEETDPMLRDAVGTFSGLTELEQITIPYDDNISNLEAGLEKDIKGWIAQYAKESQPKVDEAIETQSDAAMASDEVTESHKADVYNSIDGIDGAKVTGDTVEFKVGDTSYSIDDPKTLKNLREGVYKSQAQLDFAIKQIERRVEGEDDLKKKVTAASTDAAVVPETVTPKAAESTSSEVKKDDPIVAAEVLPTENIKSKESTEVVGEVINSVASPKDLANNPVIFAMKYIGLDENDSTSTKAASQATIAGFYEEALGGKWQGKTDEDLATRTAWCAAFANHILHKTGNQGPNTGNKYDALRAVQYKEIGDTVPLDEAKAGDLFVRDQSDEGYYHVGFYVGPNPDNEKEILVLGGNQDDKVSVKAYPKDSTLSIQRMKNIDDIPQTTIDALSKDITGANTTDR